MTIQIYIEKEAAEDIEESDKEYITIKIDKKFIDTLMETKSIGWRPLAHSNKTFTFRYKDSWED